MWDGGQFLAIAFFRGWFAKQFWIISNQNFDATLFVFILFRDWFVYSLFIWIVLTRDNIIVFNELTNGRFNYTARFLFFLVSLTFFFLSFFFNFLVSKIHQTCQKKSQFSSEHHIVSTFFKFSSIRIYGDVEFKILIHENIKCTAQS